MEEEIKQDFDRYNSRRNMNKTKRKNSEKLNKSTTKKSSKFRGASFLKTPQSSTIKMSKEIESDSEKREAAEKLAIADMILKQLGQHGADLT